jgi:hypothetical protein
LAEDELLASLGGNRLEEDLGGGPRVELAEESVDTGLSPTGEELREEDELLDGGEGVSARMTDQYGPAASAEEERRIR